MSVIIGSARIDENGKATGGKDGDQKQKKKPDYKGEVSLQKFYIHKKGWYVFRAKKKAWRLALADAMLRACNNKKIGYNQNERLDIVKAGTRTEKAVNCDCSSLVRTCIKEATGHDLGNFTTFDEPRVLLGSDLFYKYTYSRGMKLQEGDILVTQRKGHTAIVVDV